MSVDVFGRQLEKSAAAGSRGPPGVGFKFTVDGHYDIDNKRLCNVANSVQQNDAVTLNLMQREIVGVRTEILSMIHALDSRITDALRNLGADIEAGQELSTRTANIIYELDTRLTVLENEREKASTRDGAA